MMFKKLLLLSPCLSTHPLWLTSRSRLVKYHTTGVYYLYWKHKGKRWERSLETPIQSIAEKRRDEQRKVVLTLANCYKNRRMIRRLFVLALTMLAHSLSAAASNASAANLRQLNYQILQPGNSGTPQKSNTLETPHQLARIPNRKVPDVISSNDLVSPMLPDKVIPLPNANTLADFHFRQRKLGRALQLNTGAIKLFNPQVLLVKFQNAKHVAALRVPENEEVRSLGILSARQDVIFAELDFFEQRQFTPNDGQLTNQWHHARIGSFSAWDKSLGEKSIRIAIVDTPFQMDHPDLAANTISGWDVVNNQPVTNSSGIAHSTLGAGMAAAVINNQSGIAGAGNCSILPININGAISEMYDAVIWAADHDVRVVNISWTGADSSSLNDAGLYLRNKTGGVLAMAGVNGTGFLDYPNHPYITCISMTDAADNMRSRFGNHIDFAAPGYQVFSTSIGSSYTTDSGTSYSTPLFCGVLGVVFSMNPTLSPDEALDILKNTAVDKGQPGWDQFYGWGRIDFAAAAQAAQNTLPKISGISRADNEAVISIPLNPNFVYSLWKTPSLNETNWVPVTNSLITTNAGFVLLHDSNDNNTNAFYRVRLSVP